MSAGIGGADRNAATISVVVNAESSIITPRNTRHAAILVKAAYDGARVYRRVIGMYEDSIMVRYTKENVTVTLNHARISNQTMS